MEIKQVLDYLPTAEEFKQAYVYVLIAKAKHCMELRVKLSSLTLLKRIIIWWDSYKLMFHFLVHFFGSFFVLKALFIFSIIIIDVIIFDIIIKTLYSFI